jgi:hypothetical protein
VSVSVGVGVNGTGLLRAILCSPPTKGNAMRKSLFATAFVLANLGTAVAEEAKQPEGKWVTATGEADFKSEEGLSAARAKAREHAIRSAVNQVVGATVSSVSEMQDYALVRDIVFSQAAGYVSKVESVSEKVEQESGTIAVTVRALVARGAVDKDAAAIQMLIARKGGSRVYVMVEDRSVDSANKASGTGVIVRHGQFDAVLRQALREDGFTLLDPNLVDGKLRVKSAVQGIAAQQEFSEIGRAVDANIVIYGQVTVQEGEVDAGIARVSNASISGALSILVPDTGAIIGDVSLSESKSEYTAPKAKALLLESASKSAARAVRTRLYEAWRKDLGGHQAIVLSITGAQTLEAYDAFVNALKNQVRGVKGIKYESYGSEKSTVQIDYEGGGRSLATALDGKRVARMQVRVKGFTANSLQMELLGK